MQVAVLPCARPVLVLRGALGIDLQKAYYIVILSTVLQRDLLDHLQFTKLGDVLAGRAGGS